MTTTKPTIVKNSNPTKLGGRDKSARNAANTHKLTPITTKDIADLLLPFLFIIFFHFFFIGEWFFSSLVR